MYVANDNEKQGLIDAVAELQRKATEFDRKFDEFDRNVAEYDRSKFEYDQKLAELQRKSVEYGRKIARLEKITPLQQQNQYQPQKRRGGDTMRYLSFMSEDDDSTTHTFSDHPKSLRTNTKKTKSGGLFGFGRYNDNNDDEEDDEKSDQDHSLSLAIEGEVKDDEVAHISAVERGDLLRQEVHLLQEKVASLDEIVNKRSANNGERANRRLLLTNLSSTFGGEVNRRLLLPHLSSTFLQSSSPDGSKKSIILDRDTFTLMMRARWCSKPWFLGIFSFLFQVVLLFYGPYRYYTLDSGNVSPFGISMVPMYDHFLMVKCLVLVLCVMTQVDVLSSVHNIIFMTTLDTADLSTLINEEEERMVQRRKTLWITRILIPYLLKIIQGLFVLLVTFLVVLTSENSSDLLKDYTALLVISQIDNVMFFIAEYGYLGGDLAKAADQAKAVNIEVETSSTRCELIIKMIVVITLLSSIFVTFAYFVQGQQSGLYFNATYPYCDIDVNDIALIGDGICDGGIFNTIECEFDGGDCTEFNVQYPDCKAPYPRKIGDNICNQEYNIPECGYDGNDCCPFYNEDIKETRYADAMCDGGSYFATLCKLDGFDCLEFANNAPECDYETLAKLVPIGKEPRLGDGICGGSIYNTPECLFENGDCDKCNAKVYDYRLTGDGTCQGGPYNTEECNYDAGDCYSFNERWPKCVKKTKEGFSDNTKIIPIIGNDICDSGLYNNEECGYEDGDCNACNELVPNITKIGDGFCDGQHYMSDPCGSDGGDCLGCKVSHFEVGDGWCTSDHNTTECSFDGGDCLAILDEYPSCEVEFPSLLGNGICQNDTEYNTESCGWDNGDCLGIEAERGGHCGTSNDVVIKRREDFLERIDFNQSSSSHHALEAFTGWRLYSEGINLNHHSTWDITSVRFFSDKECSTRVTVQDDTVISSGFYMNEGSFDPVFVFDDFYLEGRTDRLWRGTANSNGEYFIGFEDAMADPVTVQCIRFEQAPGGMWALKIQVYDGSSWTNAYDVECLPAKYQVVTMVLDV